MIAYNLGDSLNINITDNNLLYNVHSLTVSIAHFFNHHPSAFFLSFFPFINPAFFAFFHSLLFLFFLFFYLLSYVFSVFPLHFYHQIAFFFSCKLLILAFLFLQEPFFLTFALTSISCLFLGSLILTSSSKSFFFASSFSSAQLVSTLVFPFHFFITISFFFFLGLSLSFWSFALFIPKAIVPRE